MISLNVPRHDAVVPTATTWGYFVDRGGGDIILVDHNGSRWPAGDGSMVRYAGAFTSNTLEGVHRAPRPWKFSPDGTPIVEGDFVTIEFLDDNPKRPLVRPGVRPLNPDDPAVHPVNPIGQDPNPIRARFAARNASTGAVTGTVQVTALDGSNAFEIVVGGSKFGDGTRILIDHDAGTIRLGQGADTHPVLLGDELLQTLKTVVEQLLILDGVVAAKLPSSAPAITTTLTQVLADITASLANDAPLLSTIVRVQ
jgi:hypothetical protein